LRLLWLHTIFLSPSNNASTWANTLQIILIKGSSPGHHHNHQVTLSYLSGQPATPPDSNPDENMKGGSPTPTDLTLLHPLNPQPHPPPPPPTHSSIYNSSSSSPSGLPSFLGQFNPANNNAAGRIILSSSCHPHPLNSFNKSQFYHFVAMTIMILKNV
jgi:hypothetical protein